MTRLVCALGKTSNKNLNSSGWISYRMPRVEWSRQLQAPCHPNQNSLHWEEENRSSTDGSGLPTPPRILRNRAPHSLQNSAEPLGFCRRVLRKGLHSRRPVEEPSHKTPKVLQKFGSQAQLLRALSKFFSYTYIQIILIRPGLRRG